MKHLFKIYNLYKMMNLYFLQWFFKNYYKIIILDIAFQFQVQTIPRFMIDFWTYYHLLFKMFLFTFIPWLFFPILHHFSLGILYLFLSMIESSLCNLFSIFDFLHYYFDFYYFLSFNSIFRWHLRYLFDCIWLNFRPAV